MDPPTVKDRWQTDAFACLHILFKNEILQPTHINICLLLSLPYLSFLSTSLLSLSLSLPLLLSL